MWNKRLYYSNEYLDKDKQNILYKKGTSKNIVDEAFEVFSLGSEIKRILLTFLNAHQKVIYHN